MATFAELNIHVKGDPRGSQKVESQAKDTARKVDREFDKSTKSVESNFKKMARRAQSSLDRIGSKMKSVGSFMSTRFTLPIAAAGGVIAKFAGDFEQGMNRVQAITSATGKRFQEMERLARELGETTQFSATQASEAMVFLAQAGFEVDQIIGALPGTLNLAAAAQIDLGRAADLSSNILSGFGKEATELDGIVDVMAKTFTSSNTNIEQLGEAMKLVGPVAASAGLTIEETSAAIGLLGNAGIQGTLAGTSLRRAIANLISPTDQIKESMERLGLEALDSQGNLRSLEDIIRQLEESGATTADFFDIFGQRAGPAMAALVSQGSEALVNLDDKLQNAGGTAERIADKQMEGLKGQLLELKSAFEGLAISIGESGLLEDLTSLAEFSTNILRSLSKTNPEILRLGTVLAGVTAVIGPLLLVGGTFVAFLGGPFVATVGAAALAIGGITAAGLAVVDNWEFIKSEASRIWNSIVQAIQDSINRIIDGWNWLKQKFGEIPGVTATVTEHVDFMSDSIDNSAQEMNKANEGLVRYRKTFGSVNEEITKGMVNFNDLKEGAENQNTQLKKTADEGLQKYRDMVGDSWKHSLLMTLEGNNLINMLSDLEDQSKDTADELDKQKDQQDKNTESTEKAKSEAELFTESLEDQEKELKQSIEAFKLAMDSTLDYEAALQVVQARALGLEGSVSDLIKKIQELREAEAFEEEFFRAFKDVAVTDTTGWDIVFPEPENEGQDRGETFGESLTKGMLDEFRNTIAGGLEKIFTLEFDSVLDVVKDFGRRAVAIISQQLSRGITAGITNARGGLSVGGALGGLLSFGDFFGTGPSSQAAVNTITGNTGPFGLAGGIANPAPSGLLGTLLAGGGIGLGIGGIVGGGSTGGLIGGGLGGAAGGFAGSSLIGSVLGIGGGPIGAVLGGVLGGLLGDVIGGLFSDRPRLDVEVFHLGNEEEIQADIAAGINRTVGDVIRLGFDEAFRNEQIFVKGKGGAEDIAEAEQLREQVAASLNNTVDRIFGIINQLPSDLAGTLRNNLRNTTLTFEQLADDVSLEFDEGSSDMEDINKRWEQFITKGLPARFLTTIESFFTNTIAGFGVSADAAEEFVNSRLNEIRNTESRQLRGQLGEEFLQDFQTFVDAFNFVEGNFGDSIDQGINNLRTLAEGIDGISGETLPTINTLQLLTEELLRTGDVSQESLKKIFQLRSGIVELTFSIAQSISSLTQTITDLGGASSITSSALQQSVEVLTNMAESEGLSLEERQRAIGLASSQIDRMIQDAQRQQSQAEQRAIESRRNAIRSEIEVLRERESMLRDQLRLIENQKRLVESIDNNIQNLLLGPQSIESPFQQLARAGQELSTLRNELSGATGEDRLGVAKRIQDLLNTTLDIGGRAFQQPSLEFRSIFRETVDGLEDLKEEVGPVRSVEEINARIESINTRIEVLNERSNQLQEQGNNITASIPPELQRLRERLRVQAEQILERRLAQLQETGFQSVNVEANQLSVLQQIRDILATKDMGTGGPRAPLPGGGPTGQTTTGGQVFGFGSLSAGNIPSFDEGGIGDFGRGTLAMLHGIEAIIPERLFRGASRTELTPPPSSSAPRSIKNEFNVSVTVEGNVDSEDRADQIARKVIRQFKFDPEMRRTLSSINNRRGS